MSLTAQELSSADSSRPRLLMLTHRLPFPPDRGDRIRSYHLMRELSKRFRITLAAVSEKPAAEATLATLRGFAERVEVAQIDAGRSKRQAARAMLRGRSGTWGAFFDRQLARAVVGMHMDEPFDAILTFCTGMVRYAQRVVEARRDVSVRHVLDLVDVDSQKWAAYAAEARGPMRWIYGAEARRLGRLEMRFGGSADAVTVVSDAEAAVYREQVGVDGNLRVVGNGVDTDYFEPLADPCNETLVFTGVLDYRPNVEALRWFCGEVMPRLRARLPRAKLLMVGKNPSEAVKRLEGQDGVELVGPVPDVRPWIGKGSVVVAPLRMARGVQNKVLEAMACERAVVCSPAAAEGLEARSGLHLAVAGDAERFAVMAERLLTSRTGRQRMAKMAREQVCKAYSWEQVLSPMAGLLGVGEVEAGREMVAA